MERGKGQRSEGEVKDKRQSWPERTEVSLGIADAYHAHSDGAKARTRDSGPVEGLRFASLTIKLAPCPYHRAFPTYRAFPNLVQGDGGDSLARVFCGTGCPAGPAAALRHRFLHPAVPTVPTMPALPALLALPALTPKPSTSHCDLALQPCI
ncbi:hypothetical protein AOQ84DRAFT_223260 [Glonium stellatum]|uniref:Uncharacterized protein n=1 Tax=Glonium stellatum TaxID=574774 RepID=A0A8E2EY61_9PEZI|nr:hypothetical protein AOQ84DRAFT_223260 [Glonium stellatum]